MGDIFKVDLIPAAQFSQTRLSKNHVNLNVYHDAASALLEPKRHRETVLQALKSPDSRVWPTWDYSDFMMTKINYMKKCKKHGIPTIDTIIIENGFHPKRVLKLVKQKGWSKFLVKTA